MIGGLAVACLLGLAPGCALSVDAAVVTAARDVCTGRGVPAAASYSSSGGNHIVLLDQDGGDHAWTDIAPAEWRPVAIGDLELVACIDATEHVTRQDVCDSNGITVDRIWVERDAQVIDAHSASVVTHISMTAAPPACEINDEIATLELRGDVGWPLILSHLRGLVMNGVFVDPDPTPAVD
jgi:hypothetical protein